MGGDKILTIAIIDLQEVNAWDKQSLQAEINRRAIQLFDNFENEGRNRSSVESTIIPENIDVQREKEEVREIVPVIQNVVKRKKGKPSRMKMQHPQDNFKPNHMSILPELLALPLVCIDDNLCVYKFEAGYYEALTLYDDKFLNYLYKHCPFWFKPYLQQSMAGKLYHELIGACQTYQKYRSFTAKEVDDAKKRFILTKDCVYDIETSGVWEFCSELPFVQKGLDISLLPFYQENKPDIAIFNDFLNDISTGSEKVKKLFKEFLGFVFANHAYNPKKIVVLYGHTYTIKTIIKFIVDCLNKENISHIPIMELTDKYALREIEHKSLNISCHTDSQTLIKELEDIIRVLANEYIYAGNKASECTILNDKCFVLCTDESLNINTLIDSLDFIDSILLIPVGKAVAKVKEISTRAMELKSVAGYIFLEAMETRRDLEDNDWQFQQLPAIEEALAKACVFKVEKEASEIEAFLRYLEECCDFGVNETVLKSILKADILEYCKKYNHIPFSEKTINEGINTRACAVFGIAAEEYKDTYNKTNRGKNLSVKGEKGWRYMGIGLKEPNAMRNLQD